MLGIVSTMVNLQQLYTMVLICIEIYRPDSRFKTPVLGCMSILLVINSQVLNKIKIVVRILLKKGCTVLLRCNVALTCDGLVSKFTCTHEQINVYSQANSPVPALVL